MGKKLNALLGRKSKTPKLKTLCNLAIARITILKNQRHVRCSHAQSDVVQLLNLGQQDRALLRVEHVIKEQNMLDVLVMIDNYCHLLTDWVELVQNSRECPEELNENVSSLIFAASRCGDLPELQEIRGIFTSKYGKEFVACAVELRNNCKVNPKMIQKLSTRQASLESRQKLLKQIASNNGITLHLEDEVYATTEEKQDINQREKQSQPHEPANLNNTELPFDAHYFPEVITQGERFSESIKARQKYRDVADAAQAAFESAAYAAAAARAAVELSRSESLDENPDHHSGSNHRPETPYISGRSSKSKLENHEDAALEDIELSERGLRLDKIHTSNSLCPESEREDMAQVSKISLIKEFERSIEKAGLERTLSSSSSDADTGHQCNWEETSKMNQTPPMGREIVFDESDDESEKSKESITWLKHHCSGSDKESNLGSNKFHETTEYIANADESLSDKKKHTLYQKTPKQKPVYCRADPETYSAEARRKPRNIDVEKHFYSRLSHR